MVSPRLTKWHQGSRSCRMQTMLYGSPLWKCNSIINLWESLIYGCSKWRSTTWNAIWTFRSLQEIKECQKHPVPNLISHSLIKTFSGRIFTLLQDLQNQFSHNWQRWNGSSYPLYQENTHKQGISKWTLKYISTSLEETHNTQEAWHSSFKSTLLSPAWNAMFTISIMHWSLCGKTSLITYP